MGKGENLGGTAWRKDPDRIKGMGGARSSGITEGRAIDFTDKPVPFFQDSVGNPSAKLEARVLHAVMNDAA